MSMRAVGFACLLTVALFGEGVAAGQPSRPDTSAHARLLDVPFVPQREALCGGAAVAMVLRYWNTAPVYAEDFASLVNDSAEGISVGDLARAVRDRGWRALPLAGSAVDAVAHIARGRPVIALVEDRPGRFHYVVVVAWHRGQIVFHDPASGPFRVVNEETFARAWAVTGRTTLLILPPAETTVASGATEPVTRDLPASCGEPLGRAVALAHTGDLDAAEALLSLVSEACPDYSGGPRELAGIRFLQKRWRDAVALSTQAVVRDPEDVHAWQLLASARFLDGDPDGALSAWNQRQEPRVDLARIEGLDRTRHDVMASALDLPPQTLLTDNDLRRASRRVAALPSVRASQVGYLPTASGQATVEVAVVERPLIPHNWASLAAAGLRAATDREARIDVASPTGNGELWTVTGRWWASRPRVAIALTTPQLWRWTGLWQVTGAWERQTYSTDDALIESDRRSAALTFADWTSGNLRWQISGALDHWNDRGNQVSVGAALERRFLSDRVVLRAEGAQWPRLGDATAFGSGSVTSAWRSSVGASASWTGQAGLYAVSATAPFDVWPGVDTGHVRAPLLRAHPLLVDGAIRPTGLGRVLAHGTLEFQKRLPAPPVMQLGLAAFADVAKLAKIRVPAPMLIDVGAGVRAQIAGAPGRFRLDIARGLRDGHVAVSAAWQTIWPGW